jgi:hypothetical protein
MFHYLYVTQTDHFIQEKIILRGQHLFAYRIVTPQPDVDLLRNRCIEIPLSIVGEQLRIVGRVAIDSTVCMRGLVLVGEVPWIDTHPNSIVPWITLSLLLGDAAAIIDDMLRFMSTWH